MVGALEDMVDYRRRPDIYNKLKGRGSCRSIFTLIDQDTASEA